MLRSLAAFLTSKALSLNGPALTGFNSAAAVKSAYVSSFLSLKLWVVLTTPLLTSKKESNTSFDTFKANNAVELYYDDTKTFETISGGATVTGQLNATVGAFTDITGRHGRAPANTQGGTYTLVVTDAGKIVRAGGNVTIDQNVFSEGDMLVIYNDTSGDITKPERPEDG